MGQRFVPIVIAVSDGNSEQVVKGLTNAFSHLDQTAERAGTGGLRNAFIQADLTSRAIAMATREVMEAAREYLQFGRELSNLNTLLDDGASLSGYRDGILELDPALGRTSELARGMYQAISSGVGAEDALDAITASAKAARAGLTDTFTTVDAGTSVMASFGLKSEDLTDIYDKMFETVKRGKVEFSQLASGIGLVSNIAAQSGVGVNEMFAAIATASRTNRPATAIEGMRQALVNVLKPSEQAKDLAQELGIQFDAQALKAKGLAGFLNEVATATGGNAAKMTTLFGDVQALNFVMSVTGNQAKTFASDLQGVAAASGTVEVAFEKQRQSLGAQADEMKVAFERGFIKTFLMVEPLLTGTLSLVNKYPSVFGAAFVAVAGLAAAHALYNTQIVLSAATSIPNLIKGIQSVIFWMVNFRVALTDVQTAVTATAGWAGLAIAVGILLYQLYQYETATEKATKVTLDQVNAQGESLAKSRQMAADIAVVAGAQNRSAEEHGRLNAVLGQLDPTTQTYINALKDEEQQVIAVTNAVRAKVETEKIALEARAVVFAQAILETTRAIEKEKETTETAKQAINNMQADLARGIITQDQASFTITRYAQAISNAEDKIKELNPQLADNAAKLVGVARGLGYSREQMMEFFRTSGFTEQQLQLLGSTYDRVTGSTQSNTAATNANAQAHGNATNQIAEQTQALKNLKAAQDAAASTRNLIIDVAKGKAAEQGKNTQEAKQLFNQQVANDPTLKQALETQKRVKGNLSALDDSPKGGGRAARSRVSAADQAAQATIKQSEIDARSAERLYKEATTAAQREYDLRQIALQDFVTKQIAAEETLKTFKVQALQSERDAALKLSKSTARETKLKEITEREAQIVSDSTINIQRIKDNAQKVETDALRSRVEQQLNLREEIDRREIEIIREMADQRGLSYEDAEREILAINTAAFNRRLEFLSAEEQANINNVEERERINDKIKLLTEQQVSIQEAAGRSIAAGRERDLDNLKRYRAEIRALADENARMATDIGDARLDREERLGANPRYLRQERLSRAIDAENALNLRNLERISAAFDIDFTKKSAEEVAEIQRLFNERLELEEIRHQDRLQEIREQPLVEYLQKMEGYADDIAGIFADSIVESKATIDGVLKSVEQGFIDLFKSIVRELIKSQLKEKLMSLFRPESGAEGGGGSGDLFGNLTNSFKKLFGGGGNSGGGGGSFGDRIKGILGFGSNGGAGSALTGGFAGGASPAASMASNAAIGLGTGASAAAMMGGAAATATAAGTAAGVSSGSAAAALSGGGAAGGAAAGGGSTMASMGAFFTNPWTAVAAGAVVGGLLLWNHFRNGTEKKLRKSIQSEYQIEVKDMATLKQIKQVGEQSFGKGQVSKHLLETIRLDAAKEILSAYAEGTGQKAKGLTTNRELQDPNSAQNQFIRRLDGGIVPGGTRGYDHVRALLDGGEFVNTTATVRREGAQSFEELNEGRARIVSNNMWRRMREKLRARMEAERESARAPITISSPRAGSTGSGGSGGGGRAALDLETKAILNRVANALEGIEGVDGDQLLTRTLKKNPRAAMDAVNTSAKQGHGKKDLQKTLGLV